VGIEFFFFFCGCAAGKAKGVIDEAKVARAQALRDEGLTFSQIAAELGLTDGSIAWRYVNPAKRRERDRRYAHEYDRRPDRRGSCEECGGPLGIGAKDRGRAHRCKECIVYAAELTRAKIVRLWQAGASQAEIAHEVGAASVNSMGVRIVQMRQAGYDLPYRREWAKA
jgi:hypothetical protein